MIAPLSVIGAMADAYQKELELFQENVTELLLGLYSGPGPGPGPGPEDDFLSVSWTHRLLDVFLFCFEEFRLLLSIHGPVLFPDVLYLLVGDFFERAMKALDICNAIRGGIDQLRRLQEHMIIVFMSIGSDQEIKSDGKLWQARKALTEITLITCGIDDDDVNPSQRRCRRHRTFGAAEIIFAEEQHRPAKGYLQYHSWSARRTWSAQRELQSMARSLKSPETYDVVGTKRIAVSVYTMNMLLVFVMWALVATLPCQGRGLDVQLPVDSGYQWEAALAALRDRIVEESKKDQRKHDIGLLKEIDATAKISRRLIVLLDTIELPADEVELRREVEELAIVHDAIEEGLFFLEMQVKEVFRRIARSRTELDGSMVMPSLQIH